MKKRQGAILTTALAAVLAAAEAAAGGNDKKVCRLVVDNNEGDDSSTVVVSPAKLEELGLFHGDDQGLVLPPGIAPYQVVLIPIVSKKTTVDVMGAARETAKVLADAGIRV